MAMPTLSHRQCPKEGDPQRKKWFSLCSSSPPFPPRRREKQEHGCGFHFVVPFHQRKHGPQQKTRATHMAKPSLSRARRPEATKKTSPCGGEVEDCKARAFCVTTFRAVWRQTHKQNSWFPFGFLCRKSFPYLCRLKLRYGRFPVCSLTTGFFYVRPSRRLVRPRRSWASGNPGPSAPRAATAA